MFTDFMRKKMPCSYVYTIQSSYMFAYTLTLTHFCTHFSMAFIFQSIVMLYLMRLYQYSHVCHKKKMIQGKFIIRQA